MSRKNRPKQPAQRKLHSQEREVPDELKRLIMDGHQYFLDIEKRQREERRDAERKREPGGEA